jgi:hypothetical protein
MDLTSSPFLIRNSNKQTLIFDFNNIASEHSDDEDESSDILIGNPFTWFLCQMTHLIYWIKNFNYILKKKIIFGM